MIALKAMTALALLLGSPQAHPGVVGPGIQRAVERQGSALVQVAFEAPRARTLAGTRAAVRTVRARVLARAGTGFRLTARWDAVMGMAGRVTATGLLRLAGSPDVRRIDVDVGGHAADVQSDPLIHADQARTAGYTGNGVTVGILDSGMQLNHPDLSDALVAQACYVDAPGSCPNGAHAQTTGNAGRDDDGHGTNVAGIVTGNGTIAPIGVAPLSRVVIVRVLAADGSFATTSQVISGLQYIVKHPEFGVKVINMSLGTNALFAGTCDNVSSFTMNFASVVHALRLQGVTIFVSSGNDKATNRMELPACLSEVVAVGAVYDSSFGTNTVFCNDATAADKVTCFSNSSTALDVLAPGARITSAGVGSSTSTYYGTSQASPMAAATAADLLQKNYALTPVQIEATLKSTGQAVTDLRNGRVTPRIDVIAALNATPVGPPPPPPDTKKPVVKAKAAVVKRRKTARLRFTVTDNSGSASVVAAVFRGTKRLKQWAPKTFDSGPQFVKWAAPSKRQHLSFCVQATDAAGNVSKSCAGITVR